MRSIWACGPMRSFNGRRLALPLEHLSLQSNAEHLGLRSNAQLQREETCSPLEHLSLQSNAEHLGLRSNAQLQREVGLPLEQLGLRSNDAFGHGSQIARASACRNPQLYGTRRFQACHGNERDSFCSHSSMQDGLACRAITGGIREETNLVSKLTALGSATRNNKVPRQRTPAGA